ncbi:MAG: type II CRISPR RNA-guided endonuclease Cas9 [Bryobacteraceae bacterium]|nr:type II CRISPR RNA-guided endonuclease Cas9 [Solibacteraceae bacterium]MCO5349458.1 type II CRISPR RNA-guided endonuclease Cas9 [Bryobacteraceae bacterium]
MTYTLGLDLGARSIGWAAIGLVAGEPSSLLGMGVRIFEAGVEGDIERGRDESRGVQRRTARLARRQTRRRRQRARLLYRTLESAGLLPPVTHSPGQPLAVSIQSTLNELDAQLRLKYRDHPAVHHLPYLLRARALDHPLDPLELGRALYHLGQRRGFLSNRKAKAKDEDDKKSTVKDAIKQLRGEIASVRTLGEFFSQLNPQESRIRHRYTHRSMFEHEFELMWVAQAPHHPVLTPEWKDALTQILFTQRPLKDTADLVGNCEWEPTEQRAPAWSLDFQRFRMLQGVAHLRIQSPDGSQRRLTADERSKLAAKLETVAVLTPTDAKKHLGIPFRSKFTIEEDKAAKFKGNTIGARLYELLGDLWLQMSDSLKNDFLSDIAQEKTDEDVQAMLESKWGLPPDRAEAIAEKFSLPQGYASLSLTAIRKALPFLEQGLSVQEARMAAGYEIDPRVPVHEFLPPLKDSNLDIRNPAVSRTLTELRKVVNAIIRKWGKPAEIHLEVARELKKNRDQRMKDTTRMRERESLRDSIRQRIVSELGVPEDKIRRRDIELGLLYDECGGICPYTGESIGSFTSLFSGNARAQIEHIIPRSISLDDSFGNLTLCLTAENATKSNRTPYEAYHQQPERYQAILDRVKTFKGKAAGHKLARFKLETLDKQELLEQFSSRHLNDTRYASILAARYLALLFGGEIVDGKRRIIKSTGQITADLRNVWDMNSILNDGPRKTRDDHRHHAIDAAVIAVISQKYVTLLSEAAERATAERKRRYASIPPPWVGFKEAVAAEAAKINISFRADHRVTGALHEAFSYSKVGVNTKGLDVIRIRKCVHKLTPKERQAIVDQKIKFLVLEKLSEVGSIEKLEHDPPLLPNRSGPPIKIRSARIEIRGSVSAVGRGHRLRFVPEKENHHVAIYQVTRASGHIWQAEVISLRQAMHRVSIGRAQSGGNGRTEVIERKTGHGGVFLFSLMKNDTLELVDPAGTHSGLWVVKSIRSNRQLTLKRHTDATTDTASELRRTVGELIKYSAKKVVVSPLGELLPSHE